jgi:dUTPase
VQRVEMVEWIEVGELTVSDRDVFGFGSTGR